MTKKSSHPTLFFCLCGCALRDVRPEQISIGGASPRKKEATRSRLTSEVLGLRAFGLAKAAKLYSIQTRGHSEHLLMTSIDWATFHCFPPGRTCLLRCAALRERKTGKTNPDNDGDEDECMAALGSPHWAVHVDGHCTRVHHRGQQQA